MNRREILRNMVLPAILGVVVAGVALLLGGAWSTQAQTTGSTSPIGVATGAVSLNAAPTVSGANAAATATLTGASGRRVCVRGIYIIATGAAATFTLTIQDGATVVLNLGTVTAALAGPAQAVTGAPLLCGTPGNNVVVNIGAGGAAAVTTTSVIGDLS